MSNLFQLPFVTAAAADKLYFYATGTSTPQNTYQDADLTVPHANPVVANGAGNFAPIYLDPSLPDYRVTRTTSTVSGSVTYPGYPVDDVQSAADQSQQYRVKGTNPQIIFEETDATTNNKKWRIRVNSEIFSIDAGDDAESTWTPLLSIARTDQIIQRGTFTATLTGYASGPTGTINYQRVADTVFLWSKSAIIATSNATTFGLSGIPAALRPVSLSLSAVHLVTDNAADITAVARVLTDGTLTFLRVSSLSTTPSASGFTNPGNKGLPAGWFIQYPVN